MSDALTDKRAEDIDDRDLREWMEETVMTEFTPRTEHVRDVYVLAILQDEGAKGVKVTPPMRRAAEEWFDRWLDQVRAEAWDEGAPLTTAGHAVVQAARAVEEAEA